NPFTGLRILAQVRGPLRLDGARPLSSDPDLLLLVREAHHDEDVPNASLQTGVRGTDRERSSVRGQILGDDLEVHRLLRLAPPGANPQAVRHAAVAAGESDRCGDSDRAALHLHLFEAGSKLALFHLSLPLPSARSRRRLRDSQDARAPLAP